MHAVLHQWQSPWTSTFTRPTMTHLIGNMVNFIREVIQSHSAIKWCNQAALTQTTTRCHQSYQHQVNLVTLGCYRISFSSTQLISSCANHFTSSLYDHRLHSVQASQLPSAASHFQYYRHVNWVILISFYTWDTSLSIVKLFNCSCSPTQLCIMHDVPCNITTKRRVVHTSPVYVCNCC